jgi:hypothetical protein
MHMLVVVAAYIQLKALEKMAIYRLANSCVRDTNTKL